jgi:hypothetical protein
VSVDWQLRSNAPTQSMVCVVILLCVGCVLGVHWGENTGHFLYIFFEPDELFFVVLTGVAELSPVLCCMVSICVDLQTCDTWYHPTATVLVVLPVPGYHYRYVPGTVNRGRNLLSINKKALLRLSEFARFWMKTNFPIEFFNFFYILEVWRHAPPLRNQIFSRCLKNGPFS